MFCDRCGTQLQEGQSFCPRCGRAFAAVPMMPQQGRIAGHVRLLAIFWVALSAFRLIPALVLLFIAHPELHIFPPDVPEFVPVLLRTIGLLLLASGAAGIAAGWGVVPPQASARMVAVPLGCISL